MKAEQIIGNYCRLYGVTMPELYLTQTDYFVVINSSGADIKRYQRSTLLGQIIGNAMRKGIVLYIHNGWVKLLEYDNWKQFWNKYFATPKKQNKTLHNPCYDRMPQPTMFDEGKTRRPHKKGKAGGTETSFRGNMNLHRMGSPIPTTPLA